MSLKTLVFFLGNMGYPVITRLGISQFWYNHWYSDSNYSYLRNFKQDQTFIRLFKLYVKYGLTFSNTAFFHEHFFNKQSKIIRTSTSIKNLKYYRRFYFSNEKLGIEHSYFLRYKTGEYFPLRLWLIKYSDWVIICFNSFKPIKKKSTNKNKLKSEYYGLSTSLTFDRSKLKFKRFKLVYLYVSNQIHRGTLKYLF